MLFRSQKIRSHKPMAFEYNRLLGIIRNLENSLRNANMKNEAISLEKERLVRQLESSQRQFERNTRILLYVIFLLTTNYSPQINQQLQAIFANYDTAVDVGQASRRSIGPSGGSCGAGATAVILRDGDLLTIEARASDRGAAEDSVPPAADGHERRAGRPGRPWRVG